MFPCSCQVVNGGGKVSVQLIDYKNSASELYNGQCCDNLKLCIDDCDNYFNLCFTKPGSSSHCSLLDVKTAVLGDDSFRFTGDLSNGIRNPLVYSFSKWEVSLSSFLSLYFLFVCVWSNQSINQSSFIKPTKPTK